MAVYARQVLYAAELYWDTETRGSFLFGHAYIEVIALIAQECGLTEQLVDHCGGVGSTHKSLAD
jgi:hypothetical protein